MLCVGGLAGRERLEREREGKRGRGEAGFQLSDHCEVIVVLEITITTVAVVVVQLLMLLAQGDCLECIVAVRGATLVLEVIRVAHVLVLGAGCGEPPRAGIALGHLLKL